MRHAESYRFAARFTLHFLTAQGVRLDLWREVGELAEGRRSVAAIGRTVAADLALCDSLAQS